MSSEEHGPWDRRSTETTKAFAAFRAYIALGARRSVREAARQSHQNHIKTTSTGEISSVENTTVRKWLGWSAKHKWVSRSLARDEWVASTSDDQIIINILACKLALVTRAHDFLTSTDSAVFLRGARAFTLQHPRHDLSIPTRRCVEATIRQGLSRITAPAAAPSRHPTGCASARLNRHDGPATAAHASVAPQFSHKSPRCNATGVEGVQRRELRIQRRGKMGDLGLEGGVATAARPPSTSLLENVGNVGVPKKRDNPNENWPVKIPNWTASPA